MTQRFVTHLGMATILHLLLILGGVQLFGSSYLKNRLQENVTTITLMDAVFIPAARLATVKAQPKVVPPAPVKAPVAKKNPGVALPKQVVAESPVENAQVANVTQSGESVGTIDGSSQGIGRGSQGAVTTDLKALFKAELRARIDQYKSYPAMSKRLGQQGNVIVAFTLLEDGSITGIKIATASPFEMLNKSAEDAVRSLKKFRPIPKELGLEKMDVRIPIRYSLVQ